MLLFGGFAIASLLIYFLDPYLGYYNLSNIISSFSLILVIVFFIFRSIRSLRKFNKLLLFILISFCSWFVAELLFGYYTVILDTNPYPTVADFFYFLGYLFFIVLLSNLNRTYKIEISLIISTLITFSLFAFYVLYISIFIFNVYTIKGDLVELILTFVYPFFDLSVIVGGAVYYFREKDISLNKEYFSWAFISICGFFFFIADLIFGFNDLFGTTLQYRFADLFFTIGYILIGIAIIFRIYYANQINSKL